MTLDTTAKNAGIAAAQQCADSNGPTWTEAALHALTTYASLATQPFTTETAREWIGDLIPPPKDARAWGAVTAKAVRMHLLCPVGYAPARSSNGAPKRTYQAA